MNALPRLAVALFLGLGLALLSPRETRAQGVTLSCSVSMTTVSFGAIDVLPGAGNGTSGTLSISCVNVPVSSGSLYVCVAFPARAMQGPAGPLANDLYGPSPATTSWSNTTPIAVPMTALRLGQTYTTPVNAAVLPGQQSVQPGAYSQTLASSATYGTTSCTAGLLAGATSFSFQANATVLKSCNVSAGDMAFGAVGDLDAPVDGQSALSLQCTRGTGYAVSLNGGLSGAADPGGRKMTAGGQSVLYGLYQDAARSTPWGTAAAATLGGTGTSSTQTIPVYGRVPAQATPAIGTYSDTIVVSVTY